MSQNHINELYERAFEGDLNALSLTTRLARGAGVLYAGEQPRDFEASFFIPNGPINLGDETVDGINIQSQIFRSEMAAMSFNFMLYLVHTSCDAGSDDVASTAECFDPRIPFAFGKCSMASPQLCRNVKLLRGLTYPIAAEESSVPAACLAAPPDIDVGPDPDSWEIAGPAVISGPIHVVVDGVWLWIWVSDGASAEEIAQAVADAINADSVLRTMGIVAVTDGATVLTNGEFDGVLNGVLQLPLGTRGFGSPTEVPALFGWGLLALAFSLLGAAVPFFRRTD